MNASMLSGALRSACAALALCAATAHAAPLAVYDNTTVDQQWSVFFSTGYTQLGDRVQLVAPSALASLQTQFFNAGEDAVFDATLRLYSADGPVPTAVGGPFTATGLSIAAGASLTVDFGDLGDLAVPSDLWVLFSVQLVDGAGDIGLNFFDAPAVGASDRGFFLADDGTGALQAQTLLDIDNVYLRIEGSVLAVPEPGVAWLAVLPLAALAWRHRRPQAT